MLKTLSHKLNDYRTSRLMRTSRYASLMHSLPPGLLPFWASSANLEFKGIPRDALFFARAAEGLLTFFDCVRHSGMLCGLPSRAADSVWHAWLAFDRDGLDAFCLRHFGRTIQHTEAADIGAGMGNALAVCLAQARKLEGHSGAAPILPRLFALDRELAMPRGFAYWLKQRKLAYAPMTIQGVVKTDPLYPVCLSSAGLLAAGLISQSELAALSARASKQDTGGSCGGAVAGDAGGGCCGAGCGAGCGGGCGGD